MDNCSSLTSALKLYHAGFPVQPTSTLSPLITSSSSSSSAIMTAIQTTSILNNLMTTIQPASSIIPEIQAHNPFQTTLLSGTAIATVKVLIIGS